ncbi:MAG: dTDP-4-dehydrorhamnose reductase, partial [Proteobacteria bacterium]|nr:dTDP-4-dehydrorhamnose reductase [Pseudomonadota bacterium]
MIKCFLTGATGQLGVELQHTCPPDVELKGVSRDALDICQDQVVSEVVGRCRPDIIINCAAYTAVDRAEQESEHAFAVNARGAANIAKAGVKCGARVIHISTDFVFAGTGPVPYRADDATGPVNLYGASKLEGEKRVFDITRGSCLILRTAWLYSTHGRNFVNTMLRLMNERDLLRVVDDQIGNPTWTNGLARAIWKCVAIPDMHGIHHWT